MGLALQISLFSLALFSQAKSTALESSRFFLAFLACHSIGMGVGILPVGFLNHLISFLFTLIEICKSVCSLICLYIYAQSLLPLHCNFEEGRDRIVVQTYSE